jgi:branched-chain amino acid transport system substrate-binding protein
MGMNRRVLAVVAATVFVAGASVTAASGAQKTDPGVTATSITIGGTFPLTGVASLYSTIPLAEQAYFAYVNAHGGVNGRQITFDVLDDQYDPSKTVPLTQQLVEQDKVFADYGSLGTAPILSTWGYLNQQKVPQVLVATGDSYWGFSHKAYPWTIGFQPDYPGESKIYGKYIQASMPNAKIGVLYQNDAYGKNYLAGLEVGLGAGKNKIVSKQAYDVTAPNVTQQMLSLKASGANVFFDFATPTASIQALVTATKIGWSPTAEFVNNVSAPATFMHLAAANGANIDNAISSTYLEDASVPSEANLAGVKLGKQILAQYAPKLDPTNQLNFYGLASAWTMVYALQNAGKTPTRAGLMAALRSLNPAKAKNPFLYPGIQLQTSATDAFPIEQQILVKWSGGATGTWTTFGKLYNNAR